MALPAQDLAEGGRTVAERARPVAHEGRAVHGGEGLRLERGQVREDAVRHRRVGQVVRERPRLVVAERVTKAPDDVGGGERLDLAVLLQDIRAEERAFGLLEEETRVPAVGHVRRAAVAEAVPPGRDDLAVRERARRPVGDVVHADDGAHDAARGLRPGGAREPVVQRAALVGLEVAEADPTDTRGVDDLGHRVAHHGEHLAEPGVEEERLVVTDQELVELEVGLGDEGRDAEEVGRNLGHLGHAVTCLPVSVWEVAASIRTRTTSPGAAGPGKTTVFICGDFPAIQPAVRRAGPSTRTSTSVPTSRRLISAEIDSWSATRRWRRRAFSSSGTASPHFQARVPSRGEYLKRKSQAPSWYAFTVCPRKTTSRTPARASARTCSRSTAPGRLRSRPRT